MEPELRLAEIGGMSVVNKSCIRSVLVKVKTTNSQSSTSSSWH